MTRRPGLSLIEVLAAIFIMGVGLVSIFTLFPYGALNMAQALKDDRTAQSAAAADGLMRWYWKDRIVEDNFGTRQFESFFLAMDNPNAADGATVPIPVPNQKSLPPIPATSTDPSYPVVVDPMGWVARTGRPDQYWLVEPSLNNPTGADRLPRRSLHEILRTTPLPGSPAVPAADKPRYALRTCSMLDGLTYDPNGRAADANGTAAESSGGTIQREMRYNWLWVFQRPNNSDRFTVRQTIVVFDKRAHMFAPPSAESSNYTLAAFGGAGDTRLQFSGTLPPLKKGSWILDGTTTTPVVGGVLTPGVRNANFYRVVSATEATAGVLDVELATPLKPDSQTTGTPAPTLAERRFYVLNGVAEVYERNQLTGSTVGP